MTKNFRNFSFNNRFNVIYRRMYVDTKENSADMYYGVCVIGSRYWSAHNWRWDSYFCFQTTQRLCWIKQEFNVRYVSQYWIVVGRLTMSNMCCPYCDVAKSWCWLMVYVLQYTLTRSCSRAQLSTLTPCVLVAWAARLGLSSTTLRSVILINGVSRNTLITTYYLRSVGLRHSCCDATELRVNVSMLCWMLVLASLMNACIRLLAITSNKVFAVLHMFCRPGCYWLWLNLTWKWIVINYVLCYDGEGVEESVGHSSICGCLRPQARWYASARIAQCSLWSPLQQTRLAHRDSLTCWFSVSCIQEIIASS